MSKEIKLSAQKRDKKERAAILRKSGFIPACMYGPSSKNEDLKIKRSEFEKIFAVAGESRLVDLSIAGGASVKVIIKDVQRHSVSENILHADFYQVDMTKKITTEIPLHFVGESKAVKEMGGILVKEMEAIKVKCLAKDLVDNIDVDLSALAVFHDAIRMSGLKLPAGMEFVSHTDEIVATVIEQKAEVEKPVEAAAAAPAEGEKPGAAPAGKEEAKTETKESAPAKK